MKVSLLVIIILVNLKLFSNESQQPNIVWILAEDTCPELSCYGTPAVKTPFLDKLASEGIRYTNAIVTCPVCSPSRSAMITGMYQTSIGAHHHRTMNKKPLPNRIKPITYYLKKAGYFNALGCGFSAKKDFNFSGEDYFEGKDWSERNEGQPFFAQITLAVTHRNFTRDRENPISPESVEIPPYYPNNPLVRRDWANYLESVQIMDRQVGEIIKRLEDEKLIDNTVVIFIGDNGRCHVRGKEFLYEGGVLVPLIVKWEGNTPIGEVNSDLVSSIDISAEILNLAGVELPEHMEGQPFLFEKNKKREFVVAARDRCGSTYERMRCIRTKKIKYIRNYYPQLPYLVMANNYKREQYPVQTLMQVMYAEGTLTTDQNRFMAPVKPEEELYDLENDPFELNNLVNDPEYNQILILQRERLNTWVEETGDNGAIPEDPEVAAKYHKQYYKHFVLTMKKRGLKAECSPAEYLKWWEMYIGTNNLK